jgi:hypothetical protein
MSLQTNGHSLESKEKISRSMLGNTNKSPARIVSECLKRIAVQNPDKLRKACEKMFEKAQKGDSLAFREIADRIEGKVITQLNISSTALVIDASLLSEAGKLLEIIAGTVVEPEALEAEYEVDTV